MHEFRIEYSAAEGQARELLVAVRFLDARGELISSPYPGLSSSEDFPGYQYLPTQRGAGYSRLRLARPESAQVVQVSIYSWRQTEIACDHADVTVLGPTGSRQRQSLADALSGFREACKDNDLLPVIIRATASLRHGFSRPACLADAFRKLGHPVVWIGAGVTGEGETLPASGDDGLLKLPESFRAEFLEGLVLSLPPGLLVQSSCDPAALHVQSLCLAAHWRCIQDVHEDWEARISQGLAPEHSTTFERQLDRHCHLVAAAGERLGRRAEKVSDRKVTIIPNGAWATEPTDTAPVPDGPVGYFGSLARHDFDWTLLRYLATHWPDLTFELHGVGQPSGEELPSNVDVIEASTIPGPAKTAHWRGGLVLLSEASPGAGAIPVQIAEYQARGLPVLASSQCDGDTGSGLSLYDDEVDAIDMMYRWLETAAGASAEFRRNIPGWEVVGRRLLEAGVS